MKKLIPFVGIAFVVSVGLLSQLGGTVEVNKIEKEEIIKEVTPDWAEDEDAVKAAQEVIQRKAWEEELKALEASFASSTAAYEAEREAYLERKIDLEKSIGSYWRDEANIKAYIREVFKEEPWTAVEVARRESAGNFSMEQSHLTYQEDKPKWGVKKGDRELSFCFFQIHEPAHGERAERLGLDYKNSVEDCVQMAYLIYKDSGFHPWTEYHKMLAMI